MSSIRSTPVSVMRPPKPPSWRDFVGPAPKSAQLGEAVEAPEPTGRALGARSPTAEVSDLGRSSFSVPGNKPSRLARRPRARIHRTRSEHVIHAEDLPESSFTATLADTSPRDMRTRRQTDNDGRLYVEENNRRCQNWLASIEACGPLDEVDYSSGDNSSDPARSRSPEEGLSPNRCSETELIPVDESHQNVEVEIPEETFVWSLPGGNRSQYPVLGENTCNICRSRSTERGVTRKSATKCPHHRPDTLGERPRSAQEQCDSKTKEDTRPLNAGEFSESLPPDARRANTKKSHNKPCCDDEGEKTSRNGYDSGNNRSGPGRGGNRCHVSEVRESQDSDGSDVPAARSFGSYGKRASSRNVLSGEKLGFLDKPDITSD